METRKRVQIAGAGVVVAISLVWAIYSYHERTKTFPGAALFHLEKKVDLEQARADLIKANDALIEATENKTTPDPQAPTLLQVLGEQIKKFQSAQNQEGGSAFVTMASKSAIEGFEVNFIDVAAGGLIHVPANASLDPGRSRARDYVAQNPEMNIRVFVYNDKVQEVDAAGKIIREEKLPGLVH